ncbi:alkaline-phosphatase-like protein, partial [Phycomyces blakesleeanus]
MGIDRGTQKNGDEENRPLIPSQDVNSNRSTGNPDYQSIPSDERRAGGPLSIKRIILAIIVLLLMILMGVFVGGFVARAEQDTVYNNGTHGYNPTVIFISLDGVVNHDLHLSITPHISQLAKDGVQARWMTPSFPPITFPNHWSLVTGLYPETHGIVGNYFYDPQLNDSFNYKSPAQSWDGKWWGGEPIWITAEKQNLKSGVIMWPGCSSLLQGLRPTFEVPYSDYMSFDAKVDQTLDWLDLPLSERPQFVGVYVPNVDQAGHRYGPYANETMKQLQIADASIGRLLAGLEKRNLTEIVHVMVVSDHGMSQTDRSRLIYYEDGLTDEELSLIWSIEAYPSLAIRPPPCADQAEATEKLYRAFKRFQGHLERYNADHNAHFKVYKKEDIPERYHFRHHTRIPPLLVLPDPGWVLVTHEEYDPDHDDGEYSPQGVHGYDNLSPHSRAIFVGRGPLLENGLARPFWNVELYQVLTRILDIKPSANNGSLAGVLEL